MHPPLANYILIEGMLSHGDPLDALITALKGPYY